MAQKFVGKWKSDVASMKGLDEVMDAYGVEDSMKSIFREKPGFMDVKIDGEVWTVVSGVEGLESETNIYKMGEEIKAMGLDGIEHKGVSRLVDGVLEERFRPTSGKSPESVTTREINGDVMHVKVTIGGATMTYNMTRC